MKKSRIMLVEDDAALLSVLETVLEAEGYEIHATSSAEEAIDRLSHLNGEVDLIITDVNLPEMSGLTLWEKVSAGFPDLKVLFISGEEGLEVSPLLKKPFQINDLIRYVRQIFQAELP